MLSTNKMDIVDIITRVRESQELRFFLVDLICEGRAHGERRQDQFLARRESIATLAD